MSSALHYGEGNNIHHGSTEIMVNWRKSDYDKVIKRLENFIGKGNRIMLRRVIERAAMRAANTGVTMTKRGLAVDTTLKPSQIGQSVKAYRYGGGLGMAIGMRISDTARPLSDFAFTPKKPKKGTAPTVEIYRGKKHTFDKGAFVANVSAGGKSHTGIFERVGEKRLPIKSLPGPSVTGLFKANENVHQMVWDKIFETFETRIDHELGRLLNG